MSISTLSLPSHAAYHMAMPTHSHGLTATPLTQILLTHNPHLFSLATTSPFLHSAGLGTLSKSMLSKWLSQDRLYAQSYIAFIGALLARVHLPHAFVKDKSTSLRWKIVKLLSSALENINRELAFFEDVAERYQLDLEASMGHWKDGIGSGFQAAAATRQYESLFRAFGRDPSMSLLEGLVVLWATEQVYLSAWRYAANQSRQSVNYTYTHLTSANGNPRPESQQSPLPRSNGNGNTNATSVDETEEHPQPQPQSLHSPSPPPSQPQYRIPGCPSPQQEQHQTPSSQPESQADKFTNDLDAGALRREFIPNWTSPEFEKFVQEIADVTDELAEREEAWRKIDVYKAVWEHILEVERRFWPDIGVSY
jgi:thiaminase